MPLVLVVVMVGWYLAIVLASHFLPLPVFPDLPLVLVGWLFLGGLFVWGSLRRVDMIAALSRRSGRCFDHGPDGSGSTRSAA
jgi:hypothetical protein